MKSKFLKLVFGLVLTGFLSNAAFALNNDPKPGSKLRMDSEKREINVSYEVSVSIFKTIEGGEKNELQPVIETPITVQKQVNTTYFPDGRFEFRSKTISSESELSRQLDEIRNSEANEVRTSEEESTSKVTEIFMNEERTDILDQNGKVLDSQPTSENTRKEMQESIESGDLFPPCDTFDQWIETIKTEGCEVSKGDGENTMCVTCRNPDGSVTITIINLDTRSVNSVTNLDPKGEVSSLVAYESDCKGTYIKLNKMVEEFYTENEDGSRTKTTVSSVYTNYEVK